MIDKQSGTGLGDRLEAISRYLSLYAEDDKVEVCALGACRRLHTISKRDDLRRIICVW